MEKIEMNIIKKVLTCFIMWGLPLNVNQKMNLIIRLDGWKIYVSADEIIKKITLILMLVIMFETIIISTLLVIDSFWAMQRVSLAHMSAVQDCIQQNLAANRTVCLV
jgi:hypothetical protein